MSCFKSRIIGLKFIFTLALTLSFGGCAWAQDKQAAFMLGVNSLDSSLSVYTLDSQGALRQQSFYPAAKNPKAIAIHPSGKFAYAVSKTANVVVGYEIHQTNGHIELQNPQVYEVPSASPFALTIHPSGRFLYIAARAGKIAAYAIDPNNGALTAVPHSPFESQNRTRSLVVHPGGKFLYAVNAYANSLSAYRIDDATGELTPVNGSPFPAGDPHLPLRSLWPLADVPQGGGGIPYYVALDPQGRFLYVTHWGAGKITGFAVDNKSGMLTPLPGSPFDTGLNPYVVAVHPTGEYLYAGSWESNSLLGYRIDQQTGSLTPLPKKSFPLNGKSPVSLVFTADGGKAYVANSESAGITAFNVNPASGELSLLQTTQTRPGPWWLSKPVTMPQSSFSKRIYTIDKQRKKLYAWAVNSKDQAQLLDSLTLPAIDNWAAQHALGIVYVTDAAKKVIHGYRFDATTHKFAEIQESPWPLPGKPSSVQIDLNGWYIYLTTENPETLLAYGIDPSNGGLIPVQQPVPLHSSKPIGLVLDPVSRFAYTYSQNTIGWFSYRQNIGPLLFERSRYGSPVSLSYNPISTVFDPGANFLMVSHRDSRDISVYELHPISGAPAEITGSPFHLNHKISKMIVSASGALLFVYDKDAATLNAYRRNRVTGEIDDRYPLPQELAGGKITAVSLRGEYLYVADASANHLLIYGFDSRKVALYEVASVGLNARVDGIGLE